MTRNPIRLALAGCLALASLLAAGCTTGFIQEEAQRSLASFVTGVFTTAVNETIAP
ncbi:MAG: hypothetical protein AABZ12_06815 [Planctomycetota bacterium]